MTRLTNEEYEAGIIRTDKEISEAFSNLVHRKGIMSVPVQREDDDIVIGDALRELRALRALRTWVHGAVDSCLPSISVSFDPDRIQRDLREIERRTRSADAQ